MGYRSGSTGIGTPAGTGGLFVWPIGLYGGIANTGASGTTTMTNGSLYAIPLLVPKVMTFDRFAFDIATAAVDAVNVIVIRCGIYDDAGGVDEGYPGALNIDFGTVDAETSGSKEYIINKQLNSGLYWATFVQQGGPGTSDTSITTFGSHVRPGRTDNAATNSRGFVMTGQGANAALPANFTATKANTTVGPFFALRRSA